MNISRVFIERPVASLVLAFSFALFGGIAFLYLPVNDLPQVDFPTLSVSASLPGADPETMANTVAAPLERQLATVPGIESMTSVSSAGSTRISLTFALERDIDVAAQDVQTAIAQGLRRLPDDIELPQLRQSNPTDSPILYLALTAKTLPLPKLDEFADLMLVQRLSQVPGVAQVLVFGSQKYAVRLYLDPHQLARRKLTVNEVAETLREATLERPAGQLEGETRTHAIKGERTLQTAADFNPLILTWDNGFPIRFADIGHAEDSVENDKTATWFNGTRAIVLAVQRQPGANTVEVVDRIRAALPEVTAQLPAGVAVDILSDRSQFVRESLHEVYLTLALAVVLVIGVIYLFLRSLRATLISALVLPSSVLGTFAAMYLLGYTLNNLSLMAITLAIGFIIDDAVIVVENITRHLEMGKTPRQAALDGSREIGFTVVSMTVSLAAVFLPILFMGGILGRLFAEFAVTVGVAVLLSGIIALTLTPTLCALLLKPSEARAAGPSRLPRLERVCDTYRQALTLSMRWRGLMLVLSVLTLAATGWLAAEVKRGFIPNMDSGMLYGSTKMPEGVPFEELVKRQRQVAQIIQSHPAVEAVMSSAGQGSGGVTGGNIGRLTIRLKDRQRRPPDSVVISELREAARQVRGVEVSLHNPPSINLGRGTSSSEVQLVLLGAEFDLLKEAADKLEIQLETLPEIAQASSDLETRNPEIRVHVLEDRAQALGVAPEAVEQALFDAYGGREIGRIYGALDQYTVKLAIEPIYQRDPAALAQLYVKSRTEALVPLTSVAELASGVGPLSINHSGQQPAVTLSLEPAPGVALGTAIQAVEGAVRKHLPEGVTYRFSGAAEKFLESTTTLPLLILTTIIVIYLVLAVLYEHFGHPLTILTALPLAGFGALLALLLFNQELNIFSFVGLIMLIGIVKKNGIMMVDFALARERQGLAPTEAIVEASVVRFRPIMMTTVAALVATLPIALGFGAGAETRVPLGIAVVGGLLFSQLLTLFITPTFYVSLASASRWVMAASGRIAKSRF